MLEKAKENLRKAIWQTIKQWIAVGANFVERNGESFENLLRISREALESRKKSPRESLEC